jgi:hypothetical protein
MRSYFFETVEFIRKLALTGLLMTIKRGTVGQAFLGIAIAFFFGALTSQFYFACFVQ